MSKRARGSAAVPAVDVQVASVVNRPRVSPRTLARDVSLDGRSPNSKMWGPLTAKRFKMVKMCPRQRCGLEPERCFCICKECHRPLRGLKRCGRPGCPFGANRSPEVETPPPESPPRARLPSMNPSLLSRWPYDRPPRPDSWIHRCPCEQCPFHHFRPHVVMGVTVWHAAYRALIALQESCRAIRCGGCPPSSAKQNCWN